MSALLMLLESEVIFNEEVSEVFSFLLNSQLWL